MLRFVSSIVDTGIWPLLICFRGEDLTQQVSQSDIFISCKYSLRNSSFKRCFKKVTPWSSYLWGVACRLTGKTSCVLWGTIRSLTGSQEIVIGAWRQPDESTPQIHILFFKIKLNSTLPSTSGHANGFLLSSFPKNFYQFLLSSPAHLIRFHLIALISGG